MISTLFWILIGYLVIGSIMLISYAYHKGYFD